MGKEQFYTDATIEEFMEACEINELDEIFYEMNTEYIKRHIMISRSIILKQMKSGIQSMMF